MDSDLGAKVKKLRIAHGLTQEDVAKALEVTPGYISNCLLYTSPSPRDTR